MRRSFPTEYNAELAQTRREGGKFFKRINTANEEVGRRVENRNKAMNKKTSAGMLENNRRSHALQDLQGFNRVLSVMLETSRTPTGWNFAPKALFQPFPLEVIPGEQRPSLLCCGQTTFCK